MWRESAVFRPDILCGPCAISASGTPIRLDDDGKYDGKYGRTDQIEGTVPAVPDCEGLGWWGYTSVPADACAWWRALPTRSASDWFVRLYRLVAGRQGHDIEIDRAIGVVLETFHDLLVVRNEARCRELLARVDACGLPVVVTLSFLAATFQAREVLSPEREEVYRRLELRLRRECPTNADALLAGLL